MSAPHQLFELRTGRDSKHTPDGAVQLLATLPKLRNRIWHKLVNRNETLSWEIVVQNQTIFFQTYTPARLADYIHASLTASYPGIMITPLKTDVLQAFEAIPDHQFSLGQSQYNSYGKLKLGNSMSLPIKTYRDFTDIDPLSTLLSTLSQLAPFDRVIIQYVVAPDTDTWKARHTPGNAPSVEGEKATAIMNQRSLIDKKLGAECVKVNINLAVSAETKERSQLLLETVATTFQTLSHNQGNHLRLKKVWFAKNRFLRRMQKRSLSRGHLHLTLEEMATLYHLPNEQLVIIPNISWGKTLLGEPPENLPVVTKDTAPELKDNINVFARTQYKNASSVYGLKRADRRRHMYVIGKTGTGKSTLLANMAINDLKNNEGLCVIDPHGDLVETLLDYIPSHRINDVVYFNPSDLERTVQINLFEGENVVHRELIASGIISIFHKLYGYSWGPRLEYILRNALLTLLIMDNSRLSDILDLLTNEKFRSKMIDRLNDPILKSFWVDEYNKMTDRLRTESIASILNKVGQFVSSPLIRNVVNAQTSSFSIEKIMDEGKILLVNLSQGRLGEDNAALLGSMMITKIQLAAMARVNQTESERRDFYLYVDEFQNFATEAFNKILSEARKYRLNIILANQYIAQIPEEVQKAIFGNCGSMISFVMGADDAAVFSKEFGELYSHDDLVSLGRYQIINKISIDNIISKPFPADTLALASSSNQNREKVIKVSRERYAKKRPEAY